ncbi:hypothetical protein KEM52_006440 [Ascosphaera acerosa]|nr:hypothetical protein KEM52_006440 [Ascosphaera acerosa]
MLAADAVQQAVHAVPAVRVYRSLINQLLQTAAALKPDRNVDPPLLDSDFGDALAGVFGDADRQLKGVDEQTCRDAVETVFRDVFYRLLATGLTEEDHAFQLWSLLDLTSIFSDRGRCEPALYFWLVEELFDSQTIDGCRRIFDRLESRRERTVAVRAAHHHHHDLFCDTQSACKNFKAKSFPLLRSCNALLRRLSRAEDAVFCGRVFIYLFESFPLGDKSSVNLRGEFHTENVTTFQQIPKDEASTPAEESGSATAARTSDGATTVKEDDPDRGNAATDTSTENGSKSASHSAIDTAYTMFWSLQSIYAAPTQLFDAPTFERFKKGLGETLDLFQTREADADVYNLSSPSEEHRRGVKRRRDSSTVKTPSCTFNPRYLTSRDLFELEISDLAFRRHILVQALIILDFLLSLTPAAKERLQRGATLQHSSNRSVLYAFTLSEEDAKWAHKTKSAISSYLQSGPGGKFYYRMVDTVLTRDKNWIRWKAANCPPIESNAVSSQDYLETRTKATRTHAPKRLRAVPMGSLDFNFLAETSPDEALAIARDPQRFQNPDPTTYVAAIPTDDFDRDMATTQEEKDEAAKRKSSKIWRILRLASRTHLGRFKLLEDGQNVQALFETPTAPESSQGPNKAASSTVTEEMTATTPTPQAGDSAESAATATVATPTTQQG